MLRRSAGREYPWLTLMKRLCIDFTKINRYHIMLIEILKFPAVSLCNLAIIQPHRREFSLCRYELRAVFRVVTSK